MDVFSPSASTPQNSGPELDPRLQPTPDYGTLGPGSDISSYGTRPSSGAPQKISPDAVRLFAFAIGIALALIAVFTTRVQTARSAYRNPTSSGQRRPASATDISRLDSMKPQKQAETLLELAADCFTHQCGLELQRYARARVGY